MRVRIHLDPNCEPVGGDVRCPTCGAHRELVPADPWSPRTPVDPDARSVAGVRAARLAINES